METETGAPNLDCMTLDADELWTWAFETDQHPRRRARELFPSRPRGYFHATRQLMHYAYNKATAMRCRRKGDIDAATNYETICDRIYSELPEWARW